MPVVLFVFHFLSNFVRCVSFYDCFFQAVSKHFTLLNIYISILSQNQGGFFKFCLDFFRHLSDKGGKSSSKTQIIVSALVSQLRSRLFNQRLPIALKFSRSFKTIKNFSVQVECIFNKTN